MRSGELIERLPTGISGFDDIALGGLPVGRAALVTGTTGSGKTIFAMEFLARGIQRYGQPGVFVTMEETPEALRDNATSLGFEIERWEADGDWAFVDASADAGEEIRTVGSYDFGALLARIEHVIRRTGAKRVSFDAFGLMFSRFCDAAVVRQELIRIVAAMRSLGVTLVLTSERTQEYDGLSRYGVEEFVLDNVIVLRNVLRDERRRRTIEIVKLRGLPHRTGEWLFTIGPYEGFTVVPVGGSGVPESGASRERVSTGLPELDRMVGGGLFKGAIALLIGPVGVGKTLTALKFADAVPPGERCLFATYDETYGQLVRSAAGWGMDLAAMERANRIRVIAGRPESVTPEDHLLRLRQAFTEFRPSRVVIDTLSALECFVPLRSLVDIVVALATLCRERLITALITTVPTGQLIAPATSVSAVETADIADVSILLRYVERAGDIQRAIAVLQTRGSPHDTAIRQVRFDDAGMHIGEPLPSVAHILSGNPALAEHPPWPAEPDHKPPSAAGGDTFRTCEGS